MRHITPFCSLIAGGSGLGVVEIGLENRKTIGLQKVCGTFRAHDQPRKPGQIARPIAILTRTHGGLNHVVKQLLVSMCNTSVANHTS